MSTRMDKTIRTLDALGGVPELGVVLRAIREGEEVSQAVFAKRLKMSVSHLSDLERGVKGVSVERAARFAKVLGYPVSQFVEMAIRQQLADAGFKRAKVTIDLAAA